MPRLRASRTLLASAAMLALCLVSAWSALDDSRTQAASNSPPPAADVDFARDIRPLLSDRCFQCHGPDAKNRKASLRLDQRDSAFGKAESGELPIVAGKPEASELIKRITAADASERMPPADSGKKLSANEIALLRRWIAQGAKWQEHWAFVRPVRAALPAVKNTGWCRNEIDHFVLARLEAEGLAPSPEASHETQIRRLSLDLTGLPPTLAEIDAFLADKSEGAYEALVDRLLASPHYGEQMASQWLDGARYADTNGYQNDFARDMWPWREWVIQACNANMPYDKFISEQVAGDMLPGATAYQKLATGFCRNNRSVTEAGSIEAEWHVENIIDRVETTSTVLMGLTMGCARCHDHKYDPISQKDFYRYFGFFNSTKDQGFYNEIRGNTGPTVRVIRPEQQRRLAEFDAQIADAGKNAEFAAWLKVRRDASSPQPLPAPFRQMTLQGNLQIAEAGSPPSAKTKEATYRGGAPRWADGLPGKVLELSGDAAVDVDLGQTVQFDRDAKFSISAWVRPDAIGALWCKMDDSTSFRGFDAMMYDGGRLAVHIVHSWNDNALKVISKPRVRLGQWNHVCVTYDGTSKAAGVKIYFDGKLVPQDVEVDALKGTIITPKPFRLGRRSTSLHLKGAMGDFNIYDRTLSADEVREMVDASISHAAKSPLAGGNAAPGLSDFFAANDPQGAALKAKLTKLRSDREQFNKDELSPSVMVMEELPTPRPTYLLKRGQYDAPDKSQELQPGVPPFLPPLPAGAPLNRLTLARWLIDPTNPLVARVEVNRLWQRFFGIGLVRTPDNFGMQGDPPSHPELLDWLATELVRTGWDVKAMQKLMVMSAAYRQSSATSAELEAKDPENRLLARGPRHRLSAESIRDNALAAGGLLSLKIGGPSVKPYQPNGLWEELAGGAGQGPYQRDSGENLHRRSLYTYRKRTVPHPTTSTFDAPSWEICTVKRSRTNTPLQALALLNDETYVEAARGLGRRMMVEAGGNEARSQIEDRIRYGFRLATCRAAQPREVARLAASYQRYLDTFRADSKSADALLSVGELKPDAKLDKAEQAAYATVAAILLNLDETITKE